MSTKMSVWKSPGSVEMELVRMSTGLLNARVPMVMHLVSSRISYSIVHPFSKLSLYGIQVPLEFARTLMSAPNMDIRYFFIHS